MTGIGTWYKGRSKRFKRSVSLAVGFVGLISTFMSIIGVTLCNCLNSILWRVVVVIGIVIILIALIYICIGCIYAHSVTVKTRSTDVTISCGDIFKTSGWKVIGCDTHFDTRVDDVVISKNSLHGKLVLEHGDSEEIRAAVNREATRLKLTKNEDGMYDFPLGSIVRYESSRDNQTYLLLAMTELDANYEAHTNFAMFENMLTKMWREIIRVYAGHEIVLPLLGSGISRFDGSQKRREDLLKCILCTLNGSGLTFNSKFKIVIYGDAKDIPLYEFKDIFC